MPEGSTYTGSLCDSHSFITQIGHNVKPEADKFKPAMLSLWVLICLPASLRVGGNLVKRLGKGWVNFPNESDFHRELLLI